MSIITRMLKQVCVYWPLGSFDNQGFPVVTDPIEIKCRWKDVSEETVAADGTKMTSKSKVHVDSDVSIGGILMLGVLTDITDPVNIKENSGAHEIKRFDKTPNFRATEFLRLAWL